MAWLSAFWEVNRTEILVTALCILGIHLITGAGGFIKKRRGENIERIDTREQEPPA